MTTPTPVSICKLKHLLIWLVACLGLLQGVARAQGVAMALDRSGDVDVTSASKTARLNVLDFLPPDAEVRLAAGASATLVYLATSQEWQFSGPGRYVLQTAKPAVVQGAAPKVRGIPAPSAQAMAKLEPAQRERMALGAVVMRSAGPLRIVSPDNVDVLGPRPTLLWLAPANLPVRLSVTALASQTAVAQIVTAALQWTVPADLPPGDYMWRAELMSDTPGGQRSGRFRIIASSDERRSRLSASQDGFAQRVAYAVTLENEDLPHDALLLWRALAAERPDEASLKQWAR